MNGQIQRGRKQNDGCWELGSRAWWVGSVGLVFMGIKFPPGKMKRALEMEGGDGCTTVGMRLMPVNYALMCTSSKFLKS